MKPSQFNIRVRWHETDAAGVVHFTNFLKYFECGISEFLRSHKIRAEELSKKYHIKFFIVESFCQYKSPIYYDDLLKISVSIARVRNKSFTFRFWLFKNKKLVSLGYITYVTVDLKNKPIEIPQEIIKKLKNNR